MKAIVFNQHGGLEQVQYAEIPKPVIGPHDTLLEVRATALNRLDLWVLEGWRGLNLQYPHILGSDGAGIVVETGHAVRDFSAGDHVVVNPTLSCGSCPYCLSGRDNMCNHFAVIGEHAPGLFAEYQAVPAANLMKIPDRVGFETAAAASLVYVTAWHSLIEAGRLQAGEDVLIIGAGGGVNMASVDIARLSGARTIIVVGSTDKKLEMASKLGAHVTINRHKESWSKSVNEATHNQGVDVVVDNVGAATISNSLRALKKGGRLLTVGNTSGARFELDNRYIFARHLQIIGTSMGPRQDYEKVMQLVFAGRLSPVIDAVYPLGEGLKALQRLKDGQVCGKIVLRH